MMMKKSVVCAVVLLALVLIDVGPVAQAATCVATELSPCAAAITSGGAPSSACCQKLKQQKPCLCGYFKDPTLKQYVNSPNARKVLSSCGVSVPRC